MKENRPDTLYVPEMEHDACGIGFVAHLKGQKSHDIIENAITMLENMEHRGACGCESNTGDGAGILLQIPHRFFAEECKLLGVDLPEAGRYAVAMMFLPIEPKEYAIAKKIIEEKIIEEGFKLLGYRDVPVINKMIGPTARKGELKIEQAFIAPTHEYKDRLEFERRLFVLRNYITHSVAKVIDGADEKFYFCSLSSKTIIYKGQLITNQLRPYFPDLQDKRLISALALVHSRFSTNTFPKWRLAQPFRFIAHNGEINTIKGNINWMKAREALLESTVFTREDLDKVLPVCNSDDSDSANLDNVVELLVMGGRPLPLAMMMLVPEAWQENEIMDSYKKAFYEFHSCMMEPWDGPASLCFTDGEVVGATLDRNGLRPSRFCITNDHKVVMSSEAGALPLDESTIIQKGRLQPGKMFVADLREGRIISDDELKQEICNRKPYREWLNKHSVHIDDLWQPDATHTSEPETLLKRQIQFGITSEDLNAILVPMAESAKEPIGSMGSDVPLAVLSQQAQKLPNYFKQLFAQVSNPPIDPIRERMVMSLYTGLGGNGNILTETEDHCKRIHIPQPVLTNGMLERLRQIKHPDHKSAEIQCIFEVDGKNGRLEEAIDSVCQQAEEAIANGANIIILSDRSSNGLQAPIPSLLSTASVHHHLIAKGLRMRVSLVVEAGDVLETHHFATLIGYGAHAINPYLAFESLQDFIDRNMSISVKSYDQAVTNYINAIGYGLLKVFSKMGISTLQSYHGAQIFEAVGIGRKVIEKSFVGTVSRIGGLDYDDIAQEALVKHRKAYPTKLNPTLELEVGGVYQWKRRGEFHLFNPETIQLLQHSTSSGDYELYKKYAKSVNDQSEKACTIRSLFQFKKRTPISIEEVESRESIFKRFATGAMSFGSISHEAHTTLAIAMNRIGAKSNSGEGGEDESRFETKPNGDWERSAIKQVASGRFGVTAYYLANCTELQIKMAQGAKPGEGGQLPGHKVDEWIGRVRHSTPGVGLISPPPHHDIYSIEDLAQLIFDLKNANRDARINVKLVSEAGVGTIAAGVAKAHADVCLISGHDGGTGASPISSIRHAGLPWELGLSEAHQTLVKNDLRSRITLQTDGQLKTGRDIAIATLLGAEEWGVSTAALVVEGCIMMRKCHKNTCPVGIATQNPELRKLFTGKPEHVVNLFTFMAQELREIMAELGFRTVEEMIGKAHECLEPRPNLSHSKLRKLDLSPIIKKPEVDSHVGIYKMMQQDHNLSALVDWRTVAIAQPVLDYGQNVKKIYAEFEIKNTDRTMGTVLSHEITKRYKGMGLPDGSIHYKFRGSAGQSFGAFCSRGLQFELEGEANDYLGKGLSGARLIVYPDRKARFDPSKNMIIGNVALYGATSGEIYVRGIAGERFAVRNSGAKAVVEGVGDHGCEYMTGGTVVILGDTGRNFAAGMSGGIAYVYDPRYRLQLYCNRELVDFDPMEAEDRIALRQLIDNHYRFTESDMAKNILDNWDVALKNFIKVMPREYKAVLSKNKQLTLLKAI